MPDYLNERVLDSGLAILTAEVNQLVVCSAQPTTYAEAFTTYKLGTKATPAVGAAAARTPDGRKVTVPAISSGGNITATGTASHFALIDTVNSRLLAAGDLSVTQAVTNGNTFTLPAIDIGIPAAL